MVIKAITSGSQSEQGKDQSSVINIARYYEGIHQPISSPITYQHAPHAAVCLPAIESSFRSDPNPTPYAAPTIE